MTLVILDIAAWLVIHTATGFVVHRMPISRLQHDGWLLRVRPFERDGRVYESLGIKRWKDVLPEAGALFAGGMSKRHLPSRTPSGLRRFAVETRRAEIGHWSAMAGALLFVLWNPLPVAAAMIVYGVLVNAPFIAIQRYNRARVSRALARRSSGSIAPSDAATSRPLRRRTTGSNMPKGSPPST